ILQPEEFKSTKPLRSRPCTAPALASPSPSDAPVALLEDVRAQRTGPGRGHERVHREIELIRVVAHENEVHPGVQGLDAGTADTLGTAGDSAHAEIVGDQDTIIGPIGPQEAMHDRLRE